MGWLEKIFNETDWPRDPLLAPFRDSVWELTVDGQPRAWLTTSVSPMRSFPFFWDKQESVWFQVHWMDGGHEYPEEDYGPGWYTVKELLDGCFVASSPGTDDDITFAAIQVTGSEHDQLWKQLNHGALG